MSKITILTFGAIAEIIGKSNFAISDVASTAELKEKLETEFPALQNISYAIAVDKKMVIDSAPLHANETVALLPPFSGG